MIRTGVEARDLVVRAALAVGAVLSTACAPTGPPGTITPPVEPIGALSGMVRVAEARPLDGETGPMVVLLEPVDGARERNRLAQQFRITSSTDRFDPAFTTVAEGDFIVFANEGAVSHRLFSAAFGPDLQIPLSPKGSSAPLRIERTGELRFYCSLHPDEHFSLLATGDVFSAVVGADGSFYLAPIPEGSYRLSIWSRETQSSIRTVQIDGPSATETIQLDASAIGR